MPAVTDAPQSILVDAFEEIQLILARNACGCEKLCAIVCIVCHTLDVVSVHILPLTVAEPVLPLHFPVSIELPGKSSKNTGKVFPPLLASAALPLP